MERHEYEMEYETYEVMAERRKLEAARRAALGAGEETMTGYEQGYNGWRNYETWNVALWVDNDYVISRKMAQEAYDAQDADDTPSEMKRTAIGTLADALKEWIEDDAPDIGPSCYSDLLGAALSKVDWYQIAENCLPGLSGDHG